jgi:hypothetical protein
MNRIRIVVLLSSAAMLSLASNLVGEQPVAAKVPFAFSVADRNLPAGEYRIEHRGAFLCIENRLDHRLVTLIANPGEPSYDGRSFLSFETVNGVRRLRSVSTPDAEGSVELIAPTPGKHVREAGHSAGFGR